MFILHTLAASRAQRTLVRICLLPTVLSATTLLLAYLEARVISPALAFWEYSPMLESIVAAIAVTVGGTVLVRYVEREQRG